MIVRPSLSALRHSPLPSHARQPGDSARARLALVHPFWVLGAVLAVLLVPGSAAAQEPPEFRFSQWGSVSQRLALTDVTVEYSRPAARGRSPLFGGVVHWGEIWTPGANEATTLELSEDVTIEGTDVPAGKWSVWIIPSRVGPWEMLLDPRDTLFHTQRPELGDEGQVRFEVPTEPVDHVETLTWSFPLIDHNRGTLRMAWGETAVSVDIEARSTLPDMAITPEDAAPYVGEWTIELLQAPPGRPTPPPMPFTVTHAEDGSLRIESPLLEGPPPGAEPPGDDPAPDEDMSPRERERAEARRALAGSPAGVRPDFALVPYAEGVFRMGLLVDGVLLDVENVFFEFALDGGGATGFEVRSPDDEVLARGTPAG